MLQLKNIVKDYHTGDEVVQALKGVSVNFRRNEFVSILGQSGCGKTTLLNIVGGLDQYTSGDLVINGKSTKDFKSRDWDSYRNNSVGFVFQSYNLIPPVGIVKCRACAYFVWSIKGREKKESEGGFGEGWSGKSDSQETKPDVRWTDAESCHRQSTHKRSGYSVG